MSARTPAEVFPPGEFLKDELEARGWTQVDLAEILGRPVQAVNEIIAGKKSITPDTARGLGDTFGTGPEVWLNLESSYRLSLAPPPDEAVARRARIYELGPVKDMIRRGWIDASTDIGRLEQSMTMFFEIPTIHDEPSLAFAARKSTNYAETSPAQRAWCFRAKKLAESLKVREFSMERLRQELPKFRALARVAEDVQHVPKFLADIGIRFAVVEHLQGTRIDGAAFWLDENSPVIVMSMRYDRIDNFWFVLAHELAHVNNRDRSVDTDLVGKTALASEKKPAIERRADGMAESLLIPAEEMQAFVERHRPRFSKRAVFGFAERMSIHPGVVVGQLQHRKVIGYSHSRETLVPVRDLVTSVAVVDGWL